jgi:hypothetical protein
MTDDLVLPELPPGSGARPRWAAWREGQRQAALVVTWARARPGEAFPLSPDGCEVCGTLTAWRSGGGYGEWGSAEDGRGALGGLAAVVRALAGAGHTALGTSSRRRDGEAILHSHGELHVLLIRELTDLWADAAGAGAETRAGRTQDVLRFRPALEALLAEPALAPFLRPPWDGSDGRPVLREPPATGGIADRSKAFFLLHRHRFDEFAAATMGDYAQVRQREAGAAQGSLRLYDTRGRVLELTGLTAGYEGEGPRGTLWVLRAAGLPDAGRPEPDRPGGRRNGAAAGDLERTVFGRRAFRWPAGPETAER